MPWLVCLLYAVILIDYYPRYLDAQLRYVPPSMQGAIEDVLGFGFLAVWVTVALIFALTCWIAATKCGRRAIFVLVSVFATISAIDLFLYERLASQVLAG